MKETNELPFFARYLEGQETLQVKTRLKAGLTLKYPSDQEDTGGGHTTQKYPSDDDEGTPR
jgi:hypothetical protein